MKTRARSTSSAILASAIAATLLIAGSATAAPSARASAKAKDVFDSRGPAANVELPSHAKAGSGTSGALDTGALDASTLSLTLSDGRVIEARLQRVAKDDKAGRKSWVGTVDSMPGSMLVLTKYRSVTTGFLTLGSETWELMPTKGGKHLLYQVDERKLPDAEPVLIPTDAELDAASGGDFGTGGATTAADGGYVHDLLVVYTPAARSAYGQATLESMIQNAVAAANQAYQNSNVSITVNLVGLQEVAYNETGAMQTSLYDLRGTSDGKMDNVHALRDSLGADIVSLISQDSDACGIAWSMRSESTSFASNAFNVVKPSCLSQHSLAHEIGHNQGNMHDRASTTNTGAFAYSYGFRRCASDGTGFRTVMSYSCSGASRVTQFSNPNVSYNGYPTGIAYESDPANSSDNARSMNNTADTVAAFRGSAGGGGGGAVAPNAPSSLSASAASSSSVTVRWSDNSSDETGFKLERSGNGVDFSEVATLGAGTTSFNDGGLSARTTYYYRVRAYNSAGNSGYSNTGSVTTPEVAPPPPAAPASVGAADNGDGSASVSWVDASSNETGFEVRREKYDTKRGRWTGATTVGSVPSGVTSIADQCGPGTFRYSVRAVNSGGASAFAGPAQTTVTGGTTSSKGKGGGGKPPKDPSGKGGGKKGG